MNAAGGDRDEDIIEGRGDDGLDVEEDFQDDEATRRSTISMACFSEMMH